MVWDPQHYELFAAARTRPAHDLLDRIPRLPRDGSGLIADLGCGTGRLTAELQRRWPGARILGVDNAPPMLDAARQTAPGLTWIHADLAQWRPPDPAEMLFSNAALHWLDRHERLFPRLMQDLQPGGILAVQIPNNYGSTAYRLIREIAGESDRAEMLLSVLPPTRVLTKDAYWQVLRPHAQALDLWETEYLQGLSGENPVMEWLKGSTLLPVAEVLDAGRWQDFQARLAPVLAQAYAPQPDGTTLFPFRRLFMIARRAG